ncbi:MAG TPA: PqqD family protein [Gaiellaceae bacterium]
MKNWQPQGDEGVNTRFRVNSPRVMHERIEGEIIVIDLATGSYYSLRESAAAIWTELERGAGEDEIVAALERTYEATPEELGSSVRALVEELSAEGLIEPAGENGASAADPAPPAESGRRRAFGAPVLEKHTDMQDLILLDPVHEVDARGWPHPAPAGADGA